MLIDQSRRAGWLTFCNNLLRPQKRTSSMTDTVLCRAIASVAIFSGTVPTYLFSTGPLNYNRKEVDKLGKAI